VKNVVYRRRRADGKRERRKGRKTDKKGRRSKIDGFSLM
jgi:hypothetical protein